MKTKGNSMRYFSWFLLTVLLCWFTPAELAALPRFALMSGAKCASCHVNPTGGQMRTEYGATSFSVDLLPLRASKPEDGESEEDAFTFNPKLSENISIGGDYRSQFIYDDASKASTFQLMTMTLYGTVKLTKKILFYYKQDIVNNAYGVSGFGGPEAFAIGRILPNNWYVKGGSFMPDFGWRIDDHTAYTRGGDLGFINNAAANAGLIFVPNYKDIGVEVGGYLGGLFFSSGIFNGTGNIQKLDFSKGHSFAYTAKAEYMGTFSNVNYRVGISGYGYQSFKMGAVHAGMAFGDFVLMGEVDFTHHRLNPFSGLVNESINQMAASGEVSFQPVQGVWLIGRLDMLDPIRGRGDDWTILDSPPNYNTLKRYTFGVEFFPYPFIELRPMLRIYDEKPAINNNQFMFQTHVWF